MGRKKNKPVKSAGGLLAVRDQWPDRTYRKRNTVIYREYLGVIAGKTRFGPDIYLCDLDDSLAKLHQQYARITETDRDTINWLLKEYHASPQFKVLSKSTRDQYEDYQELLAGYICKNGRPLGQAPLAAVRRTTIRGYLDNYRAPISANRHIQYLKAAWNWALERYDHLPANPCQGVKLNKQESRERYVTDEEYGLIHPLTSGWVYWAMELAYLLRARRGEIVTIPVSTIKKKVLDWDRSKGSDGEETVITPRLRQALEGALKHSYGDATPIGDAPILLNNLGKPISKSAWNSALQRLRPKMDRLGIERFTLHDLKAKGYSDQKEQYAGHKEGKMHSTYNRKKRKVKPAK